MVSTKALLLIYEKPTGMELDQVKEEALKKNLIINGGLQLLLTDKRQHDNQSSTTYFIDTRLQINN